jgi:hypothetical protein
MLTRCIGALMLAAVAVAASGCGGTAKSSSQTASAPASSTSSTAAVATSSTTSTTTAPLTSAELTTKANAICYGIIAKRDSIKISTIQDYVIYAAQLAAYDNGAVLEMRKLTPPASMATDWHQIATNAQTLANTISKFGTYVSVHHTNGGTSSLNMAVERSIDNIVAISKRDGFKECTRI